MTQAGSGRNDEKEVAGIICDAGGTVVGRTRLQKIVYLLELAELGAGFRFGYRHYGPYCEELARGTDSARVMGLLDEQEKEAGWGGKFFVYTASGSETSRASARKSMLEVMTKANAIELELAATAAFLSRDGSADPWDETEQRKPVKAQEGRLENAKALYQELLKVAPAGKLPDI